MHIMTKPLGSLFAAVQLLKCAMNVFDFYRSQFIARSVIRECLTLGTRGARRTGPMLQTIMNEISTNFNQNDLTAFKRVFILSWS